MDHKQLKFSTSVGKHYTQNMSPFYNDVRFQVVVKLEDRKVTSDCLVAQFCILN